MRRLPAVTAAAAHSLGLLGGAVRHASASVSGWVAGKKQHASGFALVTRAGMVNQLHKQLFRRRSGFHGGAQLLNFGHDFRKLRKVYILVLQVSHNCLGRGAVALDGGGNNWGHVRQRFGICRTGSKTKHEKRAIHMFYSPAGLRHFVFVQTATGMKY
jgi:hypothetical protein